MKESQATAPFLLDISRLLSRSRASVPTGIDRVELAYARYLLAHASEQTRFCAMHPIGVMGMIDQATARRFIQALELQWGQSGSGRPAARLCGTINRGLFWHRPAAMAPGTIYLNVSHHHLTRPKVVGAFLRQTGARFVVMIHDLIPIDYPEYSRPREPARHEIRLKTVARYADSIIVPSHYVKETVCRHLTELSVDIPVHTVLHGVDASHLHTRTMELDASLRDHLKGRPYFVCLGTIEPRKNHLLLLNVWRRLVERAPSSAPVLVIVGKRGWENENILDLLDRAPALKGHIIECQSLPDTMVQTLLKGSSGLLFPSFVEGFGLPLAEALSMGVPALCSDIPVLREVGGCAASYIDPLDGPAWLDAIMRYATLGCDRTDHTLQTESFCTIFWEESVAKAISLIQ